MTVAPRSIGAGPSMANAVATAAGSKAASPSEVVRPTEAQLRWAQFHHKRRATQVRSTVQGFWQTPATPEDVEGALPEDGNATSGAESLPPQVKERKPKVSRGRRALLRVSRRSYQKRRDFILQHGFQDRIDSEDDSVGTDEGEGDGQREGINDGRRLGTTSGGVRDSIRDGGVHGGASSYGTPSTNTPLRSRRRRRCENGANDEHNGVNVNVNADTNTSIDRNIDNEMDMDMDNDKLLQSIFTKPTRRRRARTYKKGLNTATKKRLRNQFQAACHAMMMNLSATPSPSITIPTKRWIRTQEHKDASEKFHYDDVHWGMEQLRSNNGRGRDISEQVFRPMDQGASWMIHMPKKTALRDHPHFALGHAQHHLGLDQLAGGVSGDLYGDGEMQQQSYPGSASHPAHIDSQRITFDQLVDAVQQQLVTQSASFEMDPTHPGSSARPTPKMRLRYFLPGQKQAADVHSSSITEDTQGNPSRSCDSRIPSDVIDDANGDTSHADAHSAKDESGHAVGQGDGLGVGKLHAATRSMTKARKELLMDKFKRATAGGTSNQQIGASVANRANNASSTEIGDDAKDSRNGGMLTAGTTEIIDEGKIHRLREQYMQMTQRNFATSANRAQFDGTDEALCVSCWEMTTQEAGYSVGEMEHLRQQRQQRQQMRRNAQRHDGAVGGEMEMEANGAVTSICLCCHEEYERDSSANTIEDMNASSGPVSTRNGRASSSSSLSSSSRMPRSIEEQQTQHQRTSLGANANMSHAGDESPTQDVSKSRTASRADGTSSLDTGKGDEDSKHAQERGPHTSKEVVDHNDARSDVSGGLVLSALWSVGKKSVESAISGLNQTTNLNPISESTTKNETAADTAAVDNQEGSMSTGKPAPDLKARVARMSGRVGDFFSKARPSLDSKHGDDHDTDLGTVRAFRKSQDARRESGMTDDSSSMSSFRVLPGFRQMMQGLQRSSPERQAQSSRQSVGDGQSTFDMSVSSASYSKFKDARDRLNAGRAGSIIDTDGAMSDASSNFVNPRMLGNLMLSPTLLNKRLQQAIQAIEARNWDLVLHLLNANPWLAEMTEITTNQYLLHKVAFYGAESPQCPDEINEALLELFPSAVHKFDQDGNVPLHLCSAAGNLAMIKLLGEAFQSGASVRNEDGMLPLHFAIATIHEVTQRRLQRQSDGIEPDEATIPDSTDVIRTVLRFFRNAVAIADNDGNLPLHIAASCLDGSVGVDIVYLLLDEADRQMKDPYGVRFYSKVKFEDINDLDSVATMSTQRETDSAMEDDDSLVHCTMVKNNAGETPLLSAILVKADWKIIEAIAGGPGGAHAALIEDADQNNALHLLLSKDYANPPAALSVLKVAPKAASCRNALGILPIEYACMTMLPAEVILAIVLVDLPFEIENPSAAPSAARRNFGQSWWFLTCECDDHYVEIVKHVIAMCTYEQARQLCFLKGGPATDKHSAISRATPLCHEVLSMSLRFVGRFEFIGSSAIASDPTSGLKIFDALDFGASDDDMHNEGKRVLLSCYSQQQPFIEKTQSMNMVQLDSTFVEEVLTFTVNENPDHLSGRPSQYCMSLERPTLTLDGVVSGMMTNSAYQQDQSLRNKYSAKVAAVLRLIAKSLRHLHSNGVVHGDLCAEKCGKFDDGWKLMGRLEVQQVGSTFVHMGGTAIPPEAIGEVDSGVVVDTDSIPVAITQQNEVSPSIDVWGFGKLAYEVFVGKNLVDFDDIRNPSNDVVGLLELMEWNEDNLRMVFEDLLDVGIPESGADLIASCLLPAASSRPGSMDEVLDNPFWKDIRKYRQSSRQRSRRSYAATSEVGEI